MKSIQALVIGASAGGVTAILKLMDLLPKDYPIPIVVAQHLPRDSSVMFSSVFGQKRGDQVLEAMDKLPLEANKIYFAPADYHLLIESDFTLSLSQDDPVNYSRPSIDVLFESAAIAFGSTVCGILLTGGNEDGAKGLLEIQKLGGITFVQDPKDAECAAMPNAALNLLKPDFVGSLTDIAKKIIELPEVGR